MSPARHNILLCCHLAKGQGGNSRLCYFEYAVFQLASRSSGGMRSFAWRVQEGIYTITPIVGRLPVKTTALMEDELSFAGHDTGAMRKEYLGHWIGVVRPKLAWSTSKVRLV